VAALPSDHWENLMNFLVKTIRVVAGLNMIARPTDVVHHRETR